MSEVKKVYPSQINTKSLACRVPAGDYVQFLQDAINKGINLNDWLLMKVYGTKGKEQAINGIETDINTSTETNNSKESEESIYPIYINITDRNEEVELCFDNEIALTSYVNYRQQQFVKLIESRDKLTHQISELEALYEQQEKVNKLRIEAIKLCVIDYLKKEITWDTKEEFAQIKKEILPLFDLKRS
jgi:hypothetical protein